MLFYYFVGVFGLIGIMVYFGMIKVVDVEVGEDVLVFVVVGVVGMIVG